MPQAVWPGYALALLGVFILSPDALLIRLVGEGDPWLVSAWRGVIAGVIVLVYNRFLDRRSLAVQVAPAGAWFYLNIGLHAIAQISFIYAISHANVTDVLVIIAFTPLISALLSAIFLGEAVKTRTWIAVVVCALGLAVLFSQASGHSSRSSMQGLIVAVLCATTLAAQFVIIRRCPQANLTAAVGLGNILAGVLCGLFMASSLSLNANQQVAMAIMALLVAPLPFVLFVLSLRYISAAETSLVMLLESVLGSLWVWWFLAEQPSGQTLLAGLLILATLTLHSLATLRESSSKHKTFLKEKKT